MKKSITMCSSGKCYITLVTMLLLALSTSTAVEAGMNYTRPYHSGDTWLMDADDGDMLFGLSVQGDLSQNLSGTGTISLYTLNLFETRSLFEFGFINPTTLSLPDSTWSSFYNSSNGNLTIDGDISTSGYNINFTFDPTNVVFGRTDFNYYGPITSGTLPDVDTLTVVPVPSAVLLGSIGMAFASYKLRKRKEL